jgi:drug/metabolite transporter (DMT)-like permease
VQVFFSIGLGVACLGDRLRGENIIGAMAAALGVWVLAIYKLRTGAESTFIGLLLVLAAALAWAVGNIVAKRAARDHEADMFALVVWSSLVPPLPLGAASYLLEGGPTALRAYRRARVLARQQRRPGAVAVAERGVLKSSCRCSFRIVRLS